MFPQPYWAKSTDVLRKSHPLVCKSPTRRSPAVPREYPAKMPVNQFRRTGGGEPIGATYGRRPTNGDAGNMVLVKAQICAKLLSK